MLAKLYRWFWEDLLCRREHFTAQISRIAKAHPLLYRTGLGFIIGFLVAGLTFMGWFVIHIFQYIKRHPED